MAHYSIRWLSSTAPLADMECSTSSKTSVKRKAHQMIVKLFPFPVLIDTARPINANRQARIGLLTWLTEIDPHPPKTYATVVTFEKILPGLGRFFVYCYKGDGT